jgi:hypothetical protein
MHLSELKKKKKKWEINEDKISDSDHEIILFSINIDSDNLIENSIYNNQYNFEKADWKIFAEELIYSQIKKNLQAKLISYKFLEKCLKTECNRFNRSLDMLCKEINERVLDFTAWWLKTIWIIDRSFEKWSWARIIELTAVDKTCSHNQDNNWNLLNSNNRLKLAIYIEFRSDSRMNVRVIKC